VGVAGGVAKIKVPCDTVLLTAIPVVCMSCACHACLEVKSGIKIRLVYRLFYYNRFGSNDDVEATDNICNKWDVRYIIAVASKAARDCNGVTN